MRLNAKLRLHSQRYRKRLQIESLEIRRLLAADMWYGPAAFLSSTVTPTLVSCAGVDETSSGSTESSTDTPASAPLGQTFFLHSNPTATKTIYLDFDGHATTGTIWNSGSRPDPIVTPNFSLDSDLNNFSDTELSRIQAIWERVMEDFLPFDVDVTTEDPGTEALRKSGDGDDQWGVRAAIGGSSSDWYNSSAGGVAYIGSFKWSTDTPVFVFEGNLGNGNEKYTAEAISHEVGHSLGLYHDGDSSTTYYQGHGSGETGWAPIMGNGYYRALTQWSKGEYTNANQTQDDLAIITGSYGFGYRADDHSDAFAGATALVVDPTEDWGTGIIEQVSDVDYFVFSTDGSLDIQINPFSRSPNLDIGATLYDSTGTVVATSNPTDVLAAEFQLSVPGGTYYLAIDGVGKSPLSTGYSDYASLGYYSISGTAECDPVGTDDSYSTDEDQTLNVAAPGVLANDSASKGGALTATLENNATHGSVTVNLDGSFQYTPVANYSGADSFIYRVHESGAGSKTATVNITINAVNDDPVANDDAYSTDEDAALNIAASGILANDNDVDGNALTALLVSGPSHGTLTLNANGSFTYTPGAQFHGADSFTYRANDGSVNSNVATVDITVSSVNDPPLADNDTYSVNEDTVLNVSSPGVLGNDSDADGDALTALLVGDVSHGTLTLNANGSFQYTPDANFHGADSFTYRANDGTANSALATVNITVDPVNDTPVANDDAYSTDEDTALNIAASGILANDSDADGNTLTALLVSGPGHGTLTLNANGSFAYTPDAQFRGDDSFTYRARDGSVNSNVATVDITVSSVNDPPLADNDTYSVNEDTVLNVSLPGVLGNDSDADGDALTALLVGNVSHGTLTLNANGSFQYTPDANFHGADSFTYRANDGTANSALATVNITVDPVNDTPVANDDAYSTDEDTALNIAASGILANDSDADGNTLTALLVSGPGHGTLTLNANGSFTYTPGAQFHGDDSFTYRARDGSVNSNVATVDITVSSVNDPPLADNDTYSVNEDTVLNVSSPGVLGNDSDADGDALTAVLVGNVSHGTLTLNANGSFQYTPDANFHGADSFTYRANDGTANSNVATVDITVSSVNDPPLADNDTHSVNEDTVLNVSSPGILGNDSDADGDALTALLVGNVSHGTLTLNANGSFQYTPDANFHGADSFTYRANDGTANSALATVNITVDPVNDTPVANDDAYSTDEDTALNIAASGILANDSDADGNTLTALLVSGPGHGTLTLNANGSFTYTPGAQFHGDDSFTYRARDGSVNSNVATVDITVSSVNDPPLADNDTYSVNEDTVLNVSLPGVLGNDSDADGDALTALLVGNVSHGTLTLNANGSFQYTPDANFHGADSFTYRANDGTANSALATVNITVDPVNDTPVANDDAYSTDEDTALNIAASGILANDSDADGNTLTALLVSGPGHGTLTLNANGSFTYTPGAQFHGADSFTYRARDGSVNSNVATVDITVSSVNDPPLAGNDTYSLNEDTVLNVSSPGVLGNDSDADGDALTAVLVGDVSHGTLTLNANGSFHYTPDANFHGADSFTYRANDGTANSALATVNITVDPVNDTPVANDDAYSTDEDTALNIAASGILANDNDADGNALTALLVSGPSHGTLTLNANGSFTYTPEAQFRGDDSFTYRANDGSVNSNVATVDITVSSVNDPPLAGNDTYSLNEDTVLNVSSPGVLGNDSDADGDALTALLVGDVSHGTLTLNANGSFQYTPDANFHGADSFTYRANDGTANSGLATVNITVDPVNDTPVANDDAYSTDEDTALNIAASGILANDNDVDGNALTALLVSGPGHGTLTVNANGSFTYTPGAQFHGADSFTYRANDGSVNSNVATVDITVSSVNDPPLAGNDTYSINEDTVLNVSSPGVLGNDSDADGDALTAVLVGNVSHGTLTLNANGSFQYTPDANFHGADSFTYRANDGTANSSLATVNITVDPVNDTPVANDDAYSTDEDTALNIAASGILANDNDADGNALTALLVGNVSHGTLTLNANGSFQYTPDADFHGADSFTYRANDGTANSGLATVNITVDPVNDAPVANDDAYSTDEDTALNIAASGILANDNDVDGQTLTAVLVSGPSHGTLTLNANGSFTYTPSAGYTGADSFTYRASDGALESGVVTASLTVNGPVNHFYDFGTSTSPLANGYTRVSSQTRFTSQLGHGWVGGTVYDVDRATNSALDRDSVYTADGTFEVAVANGEYAVSVGLGDSGPFPHDAMALHLEGTHVETVNTSAGQVLVRDHNVIVSDGRLTLRLRDLGGDPFAVITSLALTPAPPDTTSPTVTVNQAVSQADPSSDPIIYFDVEFDETVTGFTAEDVNLSGTAPGTLQVSVTGSGPSYVVAVSGMTNSGTVVAQINAGGATDTAGNTSLASTSTDNSVTYNHQPGYRFDFGTPTSPLAGGFTRVSSQTVFTSQLGHGWVNGTIRDIDRASGSDLDRDLIYTTDGTFEVTVANGAYDVEIGLGDMGPFAHDAMAVHLEGTHVDTVNTNASQVVIRSHSVTVTDGRLTLRLQDLGGDVFTVITSLTAMPGTPDTTAPTVTVNQAAGQADPTSDSTVYFDVEFDESVTGFDAGDVNLSGSTAAGSLQAEVTGSGTTYVIAVSGMTDSGTVVAQINAGGATDAAGNTSLASTSTDNSVTYNRQPGYRFDFGTSSSPLAGGFTRVSSQSLFTSQRGHGWVNGTILEVDRATGADLDRDLNFTSDGTFELVVANGTYDVEVGLGDMGPYAHDGMAVYFEGAQVDTVSTNAGQVLVRTHSVSVADGRLTLRLQDLGGDPFAVMTSLNVVAATPDTTSPTVTINQASGQADPTTNPVIFFEVEFDEPVTGFTASDVNLSSSTAPGTMQLEVTGSGTSYVVAVSGMTDSGTVVARINAGAASDLAGNTSLASTSTDNHVTYDHQPGLQFDFGTSTSPLESGFLRVSSQTQFSSPLGYGWVGGTIRDIDRSTGSDLDRDLVYTSEGTFEVAVANGTYDVELRLGDLGPFQHDAMWVYFEGTAVDAVRTQAGQVVAKNYTVTVTDGRLTLRLRDQAGDPFVVITSMSIFPAAGAATLPNSWLANHLEYFEWNPDEVSEGEKVANVIPEVVGQSPDSFAQHTREVDQAIATWSNADDREDLGALRLGGALRELASLLAIAR